MNLEVEAYEGELRKLRECVSHIARQQTPEEYEELENDIVDDRTLAEAYELIVLDARKALKGKPE